MILLHKPKGLACEEKHIKNLRSKFRFGVILTINPGEEAAIERVSNRNDYSFPEDRDVVALLGYALPLFPIINDPPPISRHGKKHKTFFFHEGKHKNLSFEGDPFLRELAESLSSSGFCKSLGFLIDDSTEFAVKIFRDSIVRTKNPNWKNEKGIYYSNTDYLYEQFTSNTSYYAPSSAPKIDSFLASPADIVDGNLGKKLVFRRISDGMRKYFRTTANVYIEASEHPEVLPIDLATKYNGIHNPTIEYLKQLYNENKQQPFTLEIARFDNLDRDTPPRKLSIFDIKI